MASQELTEIFRILKELQTASKLQQQQVDKLLNAFEITSSSLRNTDPVSAGVKRSICEVEGTNWQQSIATEIMQNSDPSINIPMAVTERKEHIDKILDKASFQDIWKKLSIKLSIENIDNLKEKDKIAEVLEKACERARLICGMNFDTLLTANLRRIIKRNVHPELGDIYYNASNSATSSKKVCYAHNIDMFTKNMDNFHSALNDPLEHFKNNPKKVLLTDSCFSSTAELDFRFKRQRLPFAICCIRKKGYISFFVGDWAHEDKEMPNASNLNHYATLKLDKFVEPANLETPLWLEYENLLESAACPSDLNIGSVTMFMHEHRGNIICAKVMLSKDTQKPILRIYPHCSYKPAVKSIILLNFDDDGYHYLDKLVDHEDLEDDISKNKMIPESSTSYEWDGVHDVSLNDIQLTDGY